MAAAETARIIASLELQEKNFTSGINKAMGGIDRLDTRIKKSAGFWRSSLSTAVGVGLERAATAAASKGIRILTDAIADASDLAETTSKVGVVFGAASQEVLAFGDNSAAAIGLSKNAALGAVATFGNLFVSMGLGTDKAADMSTELVTLAGDLASFNNIDPTEAAEKLRAGLTGESEPLKSLGININETLIKAKALELGLVKGAQSTAELKLKTVALSAAQKEAAVATKKYGANSTQALTATVKAEKAQAALEKTTKTFPGTIDAAAKAQAAYALIFEQTATAQGDFGRTSEGLANQQRILRANFDNLSATLGTAVLPSVAKLVSKLNDLAVKSTPAIKELGEALPGILDAGIAFVEGIPWDQVASGLQMAGTFAKGLFTIFTSMPPQVQATIVALAALNKLSGGAVGGIVSELGKGLIKGVLGMNAGVVNLNAATVTGAGGAGAAGAAKGGLGVLSRVFLVGEAIGLALLVNEVRNGISDANTGFAQTLAQQNAAWLAQHPDLKALESGLAAVDAGINEIYRTDPLGLVRGESLEELRGIRVAIERQIANQKKGVVGPEVFGPPKGGTAQTGGISPAERDERLAAIIKRAQAAGRDPKDITAAAQATLQRNIIREQERTKAAVDAVRTQESRTTAAVLLTAAAVQNLERQAPIVNVSTNVYTTARDNIVGSVTRRRVVKPAGSRGAVAAEFG